MITVSLSGADCGSSLADPFNFIEQWVETAETQKMKKLRGVLTLAQSGWRRELGQVSSTPFGAPGGTSWAWKRRVSSWPFGFRFQENSAGECHFGTFDAYGLRSRRVFGGCVPIRTWRREKKGLTIESEVLDSGSGCTLKYDTITWLVGEADVWWTQSDLPMVNPGKSWVTSLEKRDLFNHV